MSSEIIGPQMHMWPPHWPPQTAAARNALDHGLSSCVTCIVAKRCLGLLDQKLLLTAQEVAYRKSISTKLNDLDLCLGVVCGHVNHCVTFAIEYLGVGNR